MNAQGLRNNLAGLLAYSAVAFAMGKLMGDRNSNEYGEFIFLAFLTMHTSVLLVMAFVGLFRERSEKGYTHVQTALVLWPSAFMLYLIGDWLL